MVARLFRINRFVVHQIEEPSTKHVGIEVPTSADFDIAHCLSSEEGFRQLLDFQAVLVEQGNSGHAD